jgi:hypothetical protein
MPNWTGLYAEVGLTIDKGCKIETSHAGDWIELDMSGGSVDAHLTIAPTAVVRLIDALSVELEKFRSARCPEDDQLGVRSGQQNPKKPSTVVTISGEQRHGHSETTELPHPPTRP